MMQEQVCITPLAINKAGQVKHFQIRLPKTAKKVIGVEIGWRFLNGSKLVPNINSDALFKRNQLVGELKLQSCEEANVFYAGELRLDRNMAYGDYTKNTQWIPEVFTHQMQSFEDVVITNADSTVINGMYKDNIGLQNQQSVSYLLKVYLWYSK
jgi:hypothetical protein